VAGARPVAANKDGRRLARARLGRFTGVGHDLVTVFLCGDVMTGRGIDQILSNNQDLWIKIF
jgi:hypothetical protein